jgi:hypothetical protein
LNRLCKLVLAQLVELALLNKLALWSKLVPELALAAELIAKLALATELMAKLALATKLIAKLVLDTELIAKLVLATELVAKLVLAAKLISKLALATKLVPELALASAKLTLAAKQAAYEAGGQAGHSTAAAAKSSAAVDPVQLGRHRRNDRLGILGNLSGQVLGELAGILGELVDALLGQLGRLRTCRAICRLSPCTNSLSGYSLYLHR